MVRKYAYVGLLALSATNLYAVDYPHVPGEFIVKFKSKISHVKSMNVGVLSQSQVENLTREDGRLGLIKFTQKSILAKSTDALLKQIAENPEVEYVEPNYIYSIENPIKGDYRQISKTLNHAFSYNPNDPQLGQLWGMSNDGNNEPGGTRSGRAGVDISAYQAWELTTGSRNIKVAVIDTGIDYTHPDLVDNMWVNEAEANGVAGVDDDGNGYVDDIHGYDFANDDGDPMDGHGHGSHCAGTIGASHDNGIGVAGVMANVELVGLKFLTDSGSGDTASAIKAIDYATELDVDLMSNSWGGGAYSQALEEAIQRASDAGIVFTAAAGNSATNNDNSPHYPSNYEVDNVISVAAHTAQDELASFSCYGATTVDIAAPGHNILSTVANGGYDVYSGTSMATPHVSGAIGLLLSYTGRLPHDELKERLIETSIPSSAYRGKVYRGGRLDAYNLITDTRPLRVEPDEDKWQSLYLDEVWESAHPYDVNLSESKSISIPGAKFIRVVVKEMDLEDYYDYIQVTDDSGAVVGQLSGQGTNVLSGYVEGESIHLLFRSDSSITKWGFVIEEVQYQ